jgi:hypothetical protein
MSEEIGSTAQEPTDAPGNDESTAAAAAFGRARGEPQPEPVEIIEETPPEPVVEDPKVLAGMTEKEIADLLGEIPKYRKQIDNLAGNNGKLNAALQKLQQETPKGEAVVVTDDDMSEIRANFPEFADMTKGALNKILGRLNTRGAGPAQTPDDYVALAKTAAQEVATNERVKTHIELLDGLHPGWSETIGLPDKDGAIPETDYRKWLATQPADYQARLSASNNAFEIGSSIKSFNEAKDASAKKQQLNKQRLANAVQPQGQVAVRGTISEQSAADKAFNARRQR